MTTESHKTHIKGVAYIGYVAVQQWRGYLAFLAFLGEWVLAGIRFFVSPNPRRWKTVVQIIDKTGVRALPIIALLSFMIGVVISYQMGNQLRAYGANVFIVNLLGLSVLREFGPLMTAILVAGRTGSAFTAELGAMRLHQEIDALNTFGIAPSVILIVPRILGLLAVMPLLIVWADIFGILGGMVMAHHMLDLTWYEFLHRFQTEIPLSALLIGLTKAPFFALLIGNIGCFQGMQVQSSADSVGTRTTRSVVLSIFFIIISDALFSILFSWMGL